VPESADQPNASPSVASPPAKSGTWPTLKTSPRALQLCRDLATHFGTTQYEVAEAALTLLHDRTEGIDTIQIPELMTTVEDLREAVGRLILQTEYLEKLSFELAAFETGRIGSP